MRTMRLPVVALLVSVTLCIPLAKELKANRLCVDSASSRFDIHVGSAGLFSAFGHDHSIAAKDIKGCAEIDWTRLEQSSVTLTFVTAAITVLDPKHPKDRPEVQKTMQEQVLKIMEFPEVTFKSERVRSIRPEAGGQRYNLIVDGPLSIRGHAEPVSISLLLERTGADAKVSGKHTLKQSTFGIKPISLAGGTVRVKDELQFEFVLMLKETR